MKNLHKHAVACLIFLYTPFCFQAQTYNISTGGSVSTCSGTLYDSGGSGSSYGNYENYTMTFCSNSGANNCLKVTFSSFNVETGSDKLKIYDGPSTAYVLIGTYDNGNVPGTIKSTTGCLTFKFTSDYSVSGNWAATIACEACPVTPVYNNPSGFVNTCNALFYDFGGSGSNYGSSQTKTTKFCSTSTNCIQANFTSFSTEAGYDFLRIYDGNSTSSSLLGTYSGTTSPGTIVGTTGCLTFSFSSDGTNTAAGWAANISCTACAAAPPKSAQNCEGAIQVCSDQAFSGNSSGSGSIVDLSSSNDDCLSGENQTSWYFFQMSTGGTVELNITPQNGIDDYDFALWGPLSGLTCPPSALPYRCSFSADDGITGLKSGSGDNSEDSGGDKWVNGMNVSASQVYVLVVDNYSESTLPFTLDWTLTNGATMNCTALPIELSEFFGEATERDINLTWETASEKDNEWFTIEKSTDAENFEAIGKVKGSGTTSFAQLYHFTDPNPVNGNNYYRLKQIDLNGESKTSAPIDVVYAIDQHYLTEIYPNPANEELKFEIHAPAMTEVEIIISDNTGRTVSEERKTIHKGETKIKCDISSLEKGIYSMQTRVKSVNYQVVQPFVKQ